MGSRLTYAQRKRLPKSDFACPMNAPGAGSYPISDPARVASAKAYYKRKDTVKCKGGKAKICARARKFGMTKKGYPGSADWRKWCK
jgi:hypothetical protein